MTNTSPIRAFIVAVTCWATTVVFTGCQAKHHAMNGHSPVKVSSHSPENIWQRQYHYSINDGSNREVTINREIDDKGFIHETVQGLNESVYSVDETGNFLLHSDTDYSSSTRVEYDPPMVVLPHDLAADNPLQKTSSMTVYQKGTDNQRDKGSCTYTISVVENATVQVGRQEISTRKIEIKRELSLRLAKGTVTTTVTWAKGLGPIKRETDQKLKTMGFIPLNKTEELTWVQLHQSR